jgi:hypothetical protein
VEASSNIALQGTQASGAALAGLRPLSAGVRRHMRWEAPQFGVGHMTQS